MMFGEYLQLIFKMDLQDLKKISTLILNTVTGIGRQR